jgi:hypothetical protein
MNLRALFLGSLFTLACGSAGGPGSDELNASGADWLTNVHKVHLNPNVTYVQPVLSADLAAPPDSTMKVDLTQHEKDYDITVTANAIVPVREGNDPFEFQLRESFWTNAWEHLPTVGLTLWYRSSSNQPWRLVKAPTDGDQGNDAHECLGPQVGEPTIELTGSDFKDLIGLTWTQQAFYDTGYVSVEERPDGVLIGGVFEIGGNYGIPGKVLSNVRSYCKDVFLTGEFAAYPMPYYRLWSLGGSYTYKLAVSLYK